MGMLRNHLDALADAVFLHCAPTRDDVIFGDELRAWATAESLQLVERHTDTDGVLTAADLDRIVPDWRERETWCCGPTGMLDAMEATGRRPPRRPAPPHRALPPRHRRGRGRRPSPSATPAPSSRPTARPRSSTPARKPASSCPRAAAWALCFGCVLPLRETSATCATASHRRHPGRQRPHPDLRVGSRQRPAIDSTAGPGTSDST